MHRKARRVILLNLFRKMREGLDSLTYVDIWHSDESLKNDISRILRGHESGRDALNAKSEMEQFGFKLRVYRTRIGLTQQDLAEQIAIHRGYLAKIERGQMVPSARVFRSIMATMIKTPRSSEIPLQTESIH